MRRLLVTVVLIALAAGTYLLVSGDEEALKDPKLLVKRLTDATKGPFEDTIAELAAMGDRAVPALLEGLTSADRSIREGAAHALGDIATDDPEVIGALMKAFEDEDDFVRWKVARALGNIGPAAKDALPMLQQAVSPKESEVVRSHAERAIQLITGK